MPRLQNIAINNKNTINKLVLLLREENSNQIQLICKKSSMPAYYLNSICAAVMFHGVTSGD